MPLLLLVSEMAFPSCDVIPLLYLENHLLLSTKWMIVTYFLRKTVLSFVGLILRRIFCPFYEILIYQ